MPPKSFEASEAAFGLTNDDYKLFCAVITNGDRITYDLASVTAYMGSTSEESTQARVTTLFTKIRRDAYEIADEMGAKANDAIRNAVAPPSNVNPRKRVREDNECENETRNVNNCQTPGCSPSSLSARTPRPGLAQQQYQQQQQPQRPHQYQQQRQYQQRPRKLQNTTVASRSPFATYTHGPREFLVPPETHEYETPPPPYTRLATAGTGVMTTARVINSSSAVNQGVGVSLAMESLSGAEGLGEGFRRGFDGHGFPLGINQVDNGLAYGAPTGSASLAYSSDARNGFGVHGNQNSNRINRLNEGYMGNVDSVNGSAMGFTLPNSLDYNLYVNRTTFYDNNLRFGDTLLNLVDNDLANGLDAIPGNSSNGATVDHGVQHISCNPRFNHLTSSNSNGISVSVPITTVSHPVQPVFQLAQNVQVPNPQNVNSNVDFLDKDGNGNGNTAAATQPNGVQPEVTVPNLEQLPVPIPAAEKTPERLPVRAPTPATTADADPIMVPQQQKEDQQFFQEENDPWDALFYLEQEQLPQGGFDSVEDQVYSTLPAEGYGLDHPNL